ncbi:MAG: hypothetical protein AB1571_02795 [Nanoarchaeota archaeon]
MKKVLIFILLVALLLTGQQCGKKQEKTEGPFVGGSNGLSVSFVQGYPPSEFFQSDTVPTKVLLKNNGESDVNAGEAKVKLYGVYLPNFGLTDVYKATSSTLRGITQYSKEGSEQEVDLGNIKYSQQVINFEDVTLRAKVCYPYKTKVQTKICLGSLSEIEKGAEQVCTITGEKLTQGSVSSAPIQITSITQKPFSSNQVLFEITLQNNGKGSVYKPVSSCEDLEDVIKRGSSENIVSIEISPADIKCSFLESESNKGTVKLIDNKKTFTCRKTVESTGSNYIQNMNIDISYKYIESTSTTVKIREG